MVFSPSGDLKWLAWLAFAIRLIAGFFIGLGMIVAYPLTPQKSWLWLKKWVREPLEE
jgi:hypothetical protein